MNVNSAKTQLCAVEGSVIKLVEMSRYLCAGLTKIASLKLVFENGLKKDPQAMGMLKRIGKMPNLGKVMKFSRILVQHCHYS